MNDIEQEVREMLRTKAAEAPVRDEPPPVVLRRTKTLRAVNGVAITAAAAAVVLGVVLGAQTFGDRTAVEPDAPITRVPWIDSQGPMDERELPACRAAQLSVSARLAPPFGGQLDFILKGSDACRLYPVLGISVLDAQGRGIEGLFALTGLTTNLDPGMRAPMAFTVVKGCAGDLASFTYVIELPSHESLRVRASSILLGPVATPCSSQDDPPHMTFFSAPPVAIDGNALDELDYTLSAPAAVQGEGVLRYEVTIRNPTGFAVRLDPCPVYRQVLLREGFMHPSSYLLNCAASDGIIPAGRQVTFEMEMDLGIVPDGEYILWWGLDSVDSHLRQTILVR
ncbi:MAG TPA: hypothetical protein VJ922_02475 [Actinomycetota bacterium]|nr:hypothetical protein [Actinomycetota bacterium]